MPHGPLGARLARTPEDVTAAQALRHRCFVEARGLPPRDGGRDRDRHDAASEHLLIEDAGDLVACLRLRAFAQPRSVADSYAAGSHDLAPLARLPGPLAEIGRLCVHPVARDGAGALRLALAALAAWAEARRIATLFGCATFEGTDPAPYGRALALLAHDHGDPRLATPQGPAPDRLAALRRMPPLLRGYLAMGAWVAPGVAIDPDLGTLHVLVVMEAARIPPARARALRAIIADHPPIG